MFKKPTFESLVERQLDDSRRELLQAEASLEYYLTWQSTLQRRILRLEGYLREKPQPMDDTGPKAWTESLDNHRTEQLAPWRNKVEQEPLTS